MEQDNLDTYDLYKPFVLQLREKRDALERHSQGWHFFEGVHAQFKASHPNFAKNLEYEEREESNDESDHP